jgi:hypothetical protein
MPNIVAQTQESDAPVAGDAAVHQGARGVISIRGDSLQAVLRVAPGFWTANIVTDVTITAAVTVDGKGGCLFGKTLEGRGHADTPAGVFCDGGAESLRLAADQAQHDLVRHIGEEIGNADRIRG